MTDICGHCGGYHELREQGWPCTWEPMRCLQFAKALTALGVDSSYVTIMAHEIERLNRDSVYRVIDGDLVCYLTDSNEIAKQIEALGAQKQAMINWLKRRVAPLSPKTNKLLLLLHIALLLCFVVPFAVLRFPILWYFRVSGWWIRRRLKTTFVDWLAENGIRK